MSPGLMDPVTPAPPVYPPWRPRRSILGPLLLLATGLIALLVRLGRISGVWLAHTYARWWPLLLVLAGVVLLAEWALDQAGPSAPPRPRRRIGGGVTALLIFLAIVGAILQPLETHAPDWTQHMQLGQDDMQQFFGDRHESQQTVDAPVAPGTVLSIVNPHGSVTLSGQSPDGQIHIAVAKQVYAYSDETATEQGKNFSPQLTRSDGRLTVSLPALSGANADLTITVPTATPVMVVSTHGDVHLSGLKAAVNVTSDHGDVELQGIGGDATVKLDRRSSSLEAHNISGTLTLEGTAQDLNVSDVGGATSFHGDFYGDTHLERLAGPVTFHTSRTTLTVAAIPGTLDLTPHADLTGDQLSGPVTLTTRSRNITLTHLNGDASITNSNGSTELSMASPAANVTIENRNGAIQLTLPAQADATLNAHTSDGEITTDLKLPVTSAGTTKSLEGSLGAGKGHILLSTSHAEISVLQGPAAVHDRERF